MNDPLWQAVHECLDERANPWTDEGVQAALAEHPEDLPALARLVRRLDAVESLPRSSSEAAVRWFMAAAVVVLSLSLLVRPEGADRAPELATVDETRPPGAPGAPGAPVAPMAQVARAAPAATTRILDFEMRVVHENEDQRSETLRSNEQWVQRCEVRAAPLAAGGPLFETTILSQQTRIRP